MKIAILMKIIHDLIDKIYVSSVNDIILAPLKINDVDLSVIELSNKFKKQLKCEVTIFTYLGEYLKTRINEVEHLIRYALALGPDSAVIVFNKDHPPYDPLAVSKALSYAIKSMGVYDLVLCGESSTDNSSSQICPRIAEELNYVLVPYVRKLEIKDNMFIAESLTDEYIRTTVFKPPAVVSAYKEIAEPQLPSILKLRKAKEKPIKIIDIHYKVKKTINLEVIKHKRKQVIFSGNPKELALKFIELIKGDTV